MPEENNSNIDESLKKDYELLNDLKKDQIKRAKLDTGFFKELVLSNQFKQDIHCKETVNCLRNRLVNLEQTSVTWKALGKFFGYVSATVAFIISVVALVKAIFK